MLRDDDGYDECNVISKRYRTIVILIAIATVILGIRGTANHDDIRDADDSHDGDGDHYDDMYYTLNP